ncbi:MAG: hypothetical protein A2782_02920 [Candidatus Blackburnbacteria bacterium RIFCSPHIGHO2_01_FULL_43_15b]|uniref:Glycosyltransferase RgtA/B/C/D-like domain-containing protein n=1 Tax=Candidatus Blackburnbacteria bacterium RIFCSPHIGHO2_01_FULL_43_15b TaxID=1797513 RepID=A0A1G1V325_9BACT|nr:MAG: hypothetical protein A2782_02920 [Candidatus Blackburnbacteria bacterium RIFCSPHIGHO2_01_FULL_43_15b]
MFTKKFLVNKNTVSILLLFLAWRVWITVFALLGIAYLPLASRNFLGGSFDNYLESPLFWGWSNFDGEHYIAIAQNGYKALEHSFFPLFPLILHLLAPEGIEKIAWAGLLVSNTFFLADLFLLWKLVRLDYSEKVAWWSLVSLVSFPTSFFFASTYTGSLFLFLALLSFLLARNGKWISSGFAGGLASATRVFGVALAPALLVEWWLQFKSRKLSFPKILLVITVFFLSLSGLVVYMFYLYKTTGSPFTFYNELSPYGEQRQVGKLILFPQVFWRYFKMIATVDRSSPIYSTTLIEFFSSVLVLFLLVVGFMKKLRPSYLVLIFTGYILSTITGSFSSLPRYILVVFPLFTLLGEILFSLRVQLKIATITISVLLLTLETMLFVRGYWVG